MKTHDKIALIITFCIIIVLTLGLFTVPVRASETQNDNSMLYVKYT